MNRNLFSTITSLRSLLGELTRQQASLRRIAKTAALLLSSGVSAVYIPEDVIRRCLSEQKPDGGWGSVPDTIWNVYLLKNLDEVKYKPAITRGLACLESQTGATGIWGGSAADTVRIPISASALYFLPELVTGPRLTALETAWLAEKNTAVYKAAYTLLAFKVSNYAPMTMGIREDIVSWLTGSQGSGGGFAATQESGAAPDVYNTALALLGLIQYPMLTEKNIMDSAADWLWNNRRGNGLWQYDEPDEGSAWGLYALYLFDSSPLNA